jgi:tRNA nucleotidyltransferase (CCA-adding enzyme)
MDLILCHTTADFDALGAAVGLTRLKLGAKVVLTGGAHPTVRDFLALHRDQYALIERRAVNTEQIQSLLIVDTQKRDRLGKTADWLDLPQLQSIEVYDHHLDIPTDIIATTRHLEAVGATTTLIVEQLQKTEIQLTTAEANVMALGIHVDTGSLTFDQTTPRDAAALAWLMAQGANVKQISAYITPSLSPELQKLLTTALDNLHTLTHNGYSLTWVMLKTPQYLPGLSSLATRLLEISETDALLLAAEYSKRQGGKVEHNSRSYLTIIGRSRIEGTNLNQLFQPLGGGGHSQAAAVNLRDVNPSQIIEQLVTQLQGQIPQPPTARELMSSPVRTIRPTTTINEAQRILLRYGHSGLVVVDEQAQLVGIISRRDIDLALHHGFGHAKVKGYMTKNIKTITPQTLLSEMQSLMVTYDIGRLPVVENGQLLGIVTRTDVLRQLYQKESEASLSNHQFPITNSQSPIPNHQLPITNYQLPITNYQLPITNYQLPITNYQSRLAPELWDLLTKAAQEAQQRGWHLYLVGGVVRDLLLAQSSDILLLKDIDLVVDGFHNSADVGAGVMLAEALQKNHPNARLDVHGAFQTAALLWHNDPVLGSLWIDIATARTEFYPYPAANPEVEASSIRQDLYRRDFTINAMAVRLTEAQSGSLALLDFFGGGLDLRSHLIRVLHPNSLIEDPTRIYRAVRFAVRLGFQIEPQTQDYIHYALESGVYERSLAENSKVPALQTRLKAELKLILQAPYWQESLQLLGRLGALRCIHPSLILDHSLWWKVRLVDRWLRRFDPNQTLEHWQMRLEVIIAHLADTARSQVANQLQLPLDSIERLQQLSLAQTTVLESLAVLQQKSEIVQLLRPYQLPTLILLAILSPRVVRRQLWQYFSNLADVQAPLNGNDLKQLGYKPGPQYREMLDALLAATLDQVIENRQEAIAFLLQHYPLPNP